MIRSHSWLSQTSSHSIHIFFLRNKFSKPTIMLHELCQLVFTIFTLNNNNNNNNNKSLFLKNVTLFSICFRYQLVLNLTNR